LRTVTLTEFQQNVGKYNNIAMREPIVITKQNRDALVLLSVEDYKRLKQPEQQEEADMTDIDKKMIADIIETHSHTIKKLAE